MTSATTSHVTTGEPPECCLFKPNRSNSRFGYEFDRVPRYLLRLYAPECCGESNETKVASRAAISKKDPTLGQRDIFSIPPREAADLLNQHLRWDRRKDPRDNLMSWTSSLLFALQLGFYRHVTQNPPPAFSDIKLCIIDTTGYPSGTFLQDVVLIRSFMHAYHPCGDRDLNSLFKIRTDDYYFGEYLSQGTLNIEGRSCHVSLEQLIQYGLFNILPELGVEQHWEHWAHSVKRLRVVLLQSPKRAQTSKTEIRKMITIGQGCFGNGFALPMTCMLLALRKRSREDETILGGLLACFSGEFKGRWFL